MTAPCNFSLARMRYKLIPLTQENSRVSCSLNVVHALMEYFIVRFREGNQRHTINKHSAGFPTSRKLISSDQQKSGQRCGIDPNEQHESLTKYQPNVTSTMDTQPTSGWATCVCTQAFHILSSQRPPSLCASCPHPSPVASFDTHHETETRPVKRKVRRDWHP